jgi:hypothetical protein
MQTALTGTLPATPLLSALIFVTAVATTKSPMSERMAVVNERTTFVLVNIAMSPVIAAHTLLVFARILSV